MNGRQCALCFREIKGNVNVEKVKTCGNCVQVLLTATQENKIAFRDKLLAADRLEEARCVQSFIQSSEEEEDGDTGQDESGSVDFRSRPLEDVRLEEVGIG